MLSAGSDVIVLPGRAPAGLVCDAFSDAYAVIRCHHPELPPVCFVVPGTGVRGVQKKKFFCLGHFSPDKWHSRRDETVLNEIMLSGETMREGGLQVLEVLLHECAHVLCWIRGLDDTSSDGRYHNKRFRAAAEELRLLVGRMDPYGLARTAPSQEAIELYGDLIADLDERCVWYRAWKGPVTQGTPPPPPPDAEQESDDGGTGKSRHKRMSITVACLCGEVRISESLHMRCELVCRDCDEEMLEVD